MVHEVQPVTSGHRLVLTYNLVDTSKSSTLPQAANLGWSHLRLLQVLQHWKQSPLSFADEGAKYLCWASSHQYTDTSLQLSSFKGADRQVVTQADRVSRECGFNVFLATVERMLSGGCEEMGYGGLRNYNHSIVDIVDDEWHLRRVADLTGRQLTTGVAISESSLIQTVIFDGEGPDDEEGEGYTGNEGCNHTSWYRKAASVPPVYSLQDRLADNLRSWS